MIFVKRKTTEQSNADKPKEGRFLMDAGGWPFWIKAYTDRYVITDADYVPTVYKHEGTVEENWELGLQKAREIWPDMCPDTRNR